MPKVVLEQPLSPILEVVGWRFESLQLAGYPIAEAVEIAERPDIDLHRACELLERGCSVEQALAILR